MKDKAVAPQEVVHDNEMLHQGVTKYYFTH